MAPEPLAHPVPAARRRTVPARPFAALACCVALLVASAAAHAQWKWRDASGSIQFSDRPPPANVPDRDILQRPAAPAPRPSAAPASAAAAKAAPGPATAAARPASSPLDRQVEARRKAEEQERAAKAKAEEERQAALRADNCSRARSTLAMLDSGQRVTRMNDKGEREFLDDRQRAEEVRRAREAIAAQCR
jgi:hypothetical protein